MAEEKEDGNEDKKVENNEPTNQETEVEVEFVEPVEPVPENKFESLKEFCEVKDPDGIGKCKINLAKLMTGDIDIEKFKDKTKEFIGSEEEKESVDDLLGRFKSQLLKKEE